MQAELARAHSIPIHKTWKADQSNFAPGSVLTQRWRLNLPHNVDYDAIFGPEAFSLFHRLMPGQIIEVIDEGMTFYAECIVMQKAGAQTRLHELVKYDLPCVGASNIDNITSGYQAFPAGAKWKVKRLAFKKPSGQMQPELVYKDSFDSELEAGNYIRQALIGTR